VTLAQRKSGDSPVATYDVYDVANRLTDVYRPPVADMNPADTSTYYPTYGQMISPHWSYVYDTAGNETAQISPAEQTAYQGNQLLRNSRLAAPSASRLHSLTKMRAGQNRAVR
jgi:hypothetical protein